MCSTHSAPTQLDGNALSVEFTLEPSDIVAVVRHELKKSKRDVFTRATIVVALLLASFAMPAIHLFVDDGSGPVRWGNWRLDLSVLAIFWFYIGYLIWSWRRRPERFVAKLLSG